MQVIQKMCPKNAFVRIPARVAIAAAITVALVAEASRAEQAKPSLADVIKPIIDRHHGVAAVAIKNLRTGESFEYNGDKPMPTASLIKLPVMITTYQAVQDGKISLDDMIELKAEDQVAGSGLLSTHFSPGMKLSLRDAIRLMISMSDNTATNLVIDKIGLPATDQRMASLGCKETQLNSKVFRRDTSISPERSQLYGLGSTTANEMLGLVERLYKHELVSKEASDQMIEHLYACEDKIKVPRLLPIGTRVAHKTGSVSQSRTDAGFIDSPAGPIAFCILTNENQDQRWTDDNEGDAFCAEVGATAYEYFNAKDGTPTAAIARTLQVGADGDLVEALQRTLNARTKPSLNISTDGDFGPETEGAVKKFQAQSGLPTTGIVDTATWKALGPLVTSEEPAPEPALVNVEVEKEPADPLAGPPYVTCKAWAVADGATGEILAGSHQDERRDPASTTKMMTAFLVTSLAEQDPSVLDEIVTFSERADATSGSTSGLKAGEQLPVGELLYGLLLPSGNDAAVALAEHFGTRLTPDSANSYDGFIAAMNRKAAEIGMKSTHFINPHGLTAAGHQTTAADLARLATLALKQPEFHKRVRTAKHGATVKSVSGYERNVVWKGTNQLLKIKGYDGIKTGTTGAAGSCLVSTAARDGRRLIIVVLGSTSTESRYTDTRNLYRWAWNDLVNTHPGAAAAGE
jgi:serine-type D-Ala-D-Ala carboxypeptidase (penicillin-binding protein 5/6)